MSTRDMVYIALFAAIIGALGVFPPLMIIQVPITAQTLGVMLAGAILGARRGGLAVLLFLLLVAVGVPALAGGRGGFGVFLGPSGGFLIGFPVGAFVIGLLTERYWDRLRFGSAVAFNVIGGIAVIYAFGIPWLAFTAELSLTEAAIGSAVFIPGDVAKAVIAGYVAVTVKRAYPLIQQT